MPDNNPPTIAERLAAAGLQVKPLDWVRVERSEWVAKTEAGVEWVAFDKRQRIKYSNDHAAEVLAMLEPIPSESHPR